MSAFSGKIYKTFRSREQAQSALTRYLDPSLTAMGLFLSGSIDHDGVTVTVDAVFSMEQAARIGRVLDLAHQLLL